jgi:hypothetical protein
MGAYLLTLPRQQTIPMDGHADRLADRARSSATS